MPAALAGRLQFDYLAADGPARPPPPVLQIGYGNLVKTCTCLPPDAELGHALDGPPHTRLTLTPVAVR